MILIFFLANLPAVIFMFTMPVQYVYCEIIACFFLFTFNEIAYVKELL
jgi:hypothetical protein